MDHPFTLSEILEDFKPPEDLNAKVWRFMSLARYIDLLDNRSVFFSRADLLGDPFEGSQTRKTVETREKFLRPREIRASQEDLKAAGKSTYVSCWHLSEYESQGMWKLYTQGGEGVAVQSNFDSLVNTLKASDSEICVGRVNYRDYENLQIPGGIFAPFYTKRHHFEHEREVRAIIFSEFCRRSVSGGATEGGVKLKVDLHALIKAVYVSPFSQPWFHRIVSSVTQSYNLRVPISPSKLRADPIY
jgi:hypothetical protein